MNPLRKESTEGNKADQLRQAFDRSFAMPPSMSSPEDEDLLMIRVAGDPYAIHLLDIAEIVTDRRVVSIPAVTPHLLGLAGIHGSIVPVFGLASILGDHQDGAISFTSCRLTHRNRKPPYDSRPRHHAAVPTPHVREISQVNLMPLMPPHPTQQGKIRDRERPREIGVV